MNTCAGHQELLLVGQYIHPLTCMKTDRVEKKKKEWFTVGALCYSTNNTICILCAMVLDYGEVTVLMNF